MLRLGHSASVLQSAEPFALELWFGHQLRFRIENTGEIRRTGLGIVYASDVVHTACNEENTIRRPGEVIDFRTR